MNEEVLRIQKMVAEGKVSPAESVELLESIGRSGAVAGDAAEHSGGWWRRYLYHLAVVAAIFVAAAGFALYFNAQRNHDKLAVKTSQLVTRLVAMTASRDEAEQLRREAASQADSVRIARDRCEQNVKTLSRAIRKWQDDNQGQMPGSLDELVRKAYLDEVPHCPFGGGRPTGDYFYLPVDEASADPDRIVLCDLYGHTADGNSHCMMFADGHVEMVADDQMGSDRIRKNAAFFRARGEAWTAAEKAAGGAIPSAGGNRR